MNSSEITKFLDFAKAGYAAALQGKSMTYEGREIKLEEPGFYIKEIERLEYMLKQINSGRNGYSPKLADLSNSR